ncbi:PTS glucose transporter subunit IIB [Metamycoplasma neophronis]|uniref:PTS glucose transporter subunit IIB n=1 Tax=Metamycoplasma neophronis TaxID=872983 RepID=A0ABY2Z0Q1_9BACT|nr:PTS glucose transporter subunit IIB [Metamycoplasma neophronis]TPR53713.1 PTS glucose transporter subunit IIB [Metamycoplasma neophronis]
MNSKQKALYIFLLIITFGLISIYWRKKYQKKQVQSQLSIEQKLSFDYDSLITALGGIKNINNVSSTHKIIKVFFENRNAIKIEDIQKLDGMSGITFQSNSISIVLGNSAKYLEEKIKKDIDHE